MRSRWLLYGCFLGLFVMCGPSIAAADGARVALVIGNATYTHVTPLRNPVNDAKAVASKLRQLGFEVYEYENLDRNQFVKAIDAAAQAMSSNTKVGLFYYAGHGLQLGWNNYLVPTDAILGHAEDVPDRTVPMQRVIDTFRHAATKTKIFILDACRDNPFDSISNGRGLAQQDAPPDSLLAYATAPGNVAEDGEGSNGLYTRNFLDALSMPGASVEDVFKRTRLGVRKASQGRQVPWESTSLEEDVHFDAAPASSRALPAGRREEQFRLELQDWKAIESSKIVSDFYSFLEKYPSGYFSELAQFHLDELAKPKVIPVPNREGIAPMVAGRGHFQVGDALTYKVSDVYGRQSGEKTSTITGQTDDTLIVNGGEQVWDRMGNLLVDGSGRRSTPKIQYPAELAVGKTWHSAYEINAGGGNLSLFWDFRVTGLETVEVPAGSFKAYRIEGKSQLANGWTQEQTYWVDAATFLMVKDHFLRRDQRLNINGSYDLQLSAIHLTH